MHTCPHDKRAAARVTGPQHTWHTAHLALVQGLGLSLALQGDLLILGADLINDAVQVQVPVVVHGQHHGCVADVGLDLSNLLGDSSGSGVRKRLLMRGAHLPILPG